MGKYYEQIPDDSKLVDWIRDQKLFHVATAPLNGMSLYAAELATNHSFRAGGRVNVSPKGYQTFKLVNRKTCWYLDLSGSGEPNN